MEVQRYSEQIMNILNTCIDDIATLVKNHGTIQFPYYINEDYFTIEQFTDLYGNFDIRYGHPFRNTTITLKDYPGNVIERDIVEIRVENNIPMLVTLENVYPIYDIVHIMDTIRLYELIVEHLNNH